MDESKTKFAEAMANLCINQLKQEEYILECYIISINFWQIELMSLLEEEPFYMFKKKHQEWEKKVKETQDYLKVLYEKFDMDLKEIQEFKKSILNI